MKWISSISNQSAVKFGLSLPEAYLFGYMFEIYGQPWVEQVDGWCWLSKRKAIEELPLLKCQPDTVYRHWRRLEQVGLIRLKTIANKNYFRITNRARGWLTSDGERVGSESDLGSESEVDGVGNKSEVGSESDQGRNEIRPEVGSESEPGSDLNPTDKYTSNNKYQDKDTRNPHACVGAREVPLKKDSPKMRIRIKQPPSAAYSEFLSMMAKSPRWKDRCAAMWYQDRGGWSYETIWAGQIRPALEQRIAECAEWQRDPQFWPRPEDVLEQRKWEDKIVPIASASTNHPAEVDWRDELRSTADA